MYVSFLDPGYQPYWLPVRGLAGAAAGEDGQFAGFFRVLNDVLAVREQAERLPRVEGIDDGVADGLTFDGDTGVAGGEGYRLLDRLSGGGPHAC